MLTRRQHFQQLKEIAIERHGDGATQTQIAKELGATRSTVSRWIHQKKKSQENQKDSLDTYTSNKDELEEWVKNQNYPTI